MHEAIPQLGLSERPLRRTGAFALSVVFLAFAALGIRYGHLHMTELRSFIPICATLWASAELVTAFLLLSQFNVAGKLAYAWMAAAYAFTGLLTLPYLFEFPGVFPLATSSGTLQISVWLWAVWHCTFPIAIGAVFLCDATLEERAVPRTAIAGTLWAIVGGVAALAALIVGGIIAYADHLPVLLDTHKHFTGLFAFVVTPAVILSNATACALVFVRRKNPTPLQLWVSVALLAATLDGLLNAISPTRYSFGWYVGKIEALSASSVVLMMLLFQVSNLYRRLFNIASVDSLTGLKNRRALDIELHAFVNDRRNKAEGAALLLIDLDHFKQFNDRYGHIAGDSALRTVATALRASVFRPGDEIARYGGEEFAVLLSDCGLAGARAVAERIRRNVEATVVRIGAQTTRITASIGIAYVPDRRGVSAESLLALADRALYAAKDDGRNRFVVAGPTTDEAPALHPALSH